MSRSRSTPFDDLDPGDRITIITHRPRETTAGTFAGFDKVAGRYWLCLDGDQPNEQYSIRTNRIAYIRRARRGKPKAA